MADRVQRTGEQLPSEEVESAQFKLDFTPDLSSEAQELTFASASHLICRLASTVKRSAASTVLLWQIADRIVGTKGIVLAAPSWKTLGTTVWRKGPDATLRLIRRNAISVLPESADSFAVASRKTSAKPRRGESESGPTHS